MNKYLIVLVVVTSLLLSSCGGGGPSTKINITLLDFQFTPNTFTVPAGALITFKAANTGAVVHNFIIMKLGASAGPFFDDDDKPNVYWEQLDIQPGGDVTATFTAPAEPGEYEILCKTEGHIASGMVGKLIVVAGE